MQQFVRVSNLGGTTTGFTVNASGSAATPQDGETKAVFKALQQALNRWVRKGSGDKSGAFDTPLAVDGILGRASLNAAQAVVRVAQINASAQTSSVEMLATRARELAVVVNMKADEAGRGYTNPTQQAPVTAVSTATGSLWTAATNAVSSMNPFANTSAGDNSGLPQTKTKIDVASTLIKTGKKPVVTSGEMVIVGDQAAAGGPGLFGFIKRHWILFGVAGVASVAGIWYYTK